MSSPSQNTPPVASEFNVTTGDGDVLILNASEISEQADVSEARPLNTSTLTSSLFKRLLVEKEDCEDLT